MTRRMIMLNETEGVFLSTIIIVLVVLHFLVVVRLGDKTIMGVGRTKNLAEPYNNDRIDYYYYSLKRHSTVQYSSDQIRSAPHQYPSTACPSMHPSNPPSWSLASSGKKASYQPLYISWQAVRVLRLVAVCVYLCCCLGVTMNGTEDDGEIFSTPSVSYLVSSIVSVNG